ESGERFTKTRNPSFSGSTPCTAAFAMTAPGSASLAGSAAAEVSTYGKKPASIARLISLNVSANRLASPVMDTFAPEGSTLGNSVIASPNAPSLGSCAGDGAPCCTFRSRPRCALPGTHTSEHTNQLTCASRCAGPGLAFAGAEIGTGNATSYSYPKSISGPSGSLSGMGNCIAPAVKPAGSVQSIFGGSPESPG